MKPTREKQPPATAHELAELEGLRRSYRKSSGEVDYHYPDPPACPVCGSLTLTISRSIHNGDWRIVRVECERGHPFVVNVHGRPPFREA